MSALVDRNAAPPWVIERTPDLDRLDAVDRKVVIEAFCRHGWVVLRGFDVDPVTYDTFARRFTVSHFIGYGRVPFPELPTITMGNETGNPLAPHCDNGTRAEQHRPDLTWFWCGTPADDAGETTLFDGIRVWNALSAETRRLLLARPIRYRSRNAWKQMRFSDLAAFERFIAAQGGTVAAVHGDIAEVEFVSPAARRPRWSDELAFTSSLALAGKPGFEAMQVSLDGEAEVPESLRLEIEDALEACCESHAWLLGDVLMIDNTRCLHGRRAYRDLRRRLYLIQTLRASF